MEKKDIKEITALTKVYDLLLWIIPVLEKFPRTQKFMLGDRIEALMLDIMDLIISAVYSRDKISYLRSANLKLEQFRYLIRLCKDLKFLNIPKYEFLAKAVNELGMEIGGWIKYDKKAEAAEI